MASGTSGANECGTGNADQDGDGLSVTIEQEIRTDPRKADTDGDGIEFIPVGKELAPFLPPWEYLLPYRRIPYPPPAAPQPDTPPAGSGGTTTPPPPTP